MYTQTHKDCKAIKGLPPYEKGPEQKAKKKNQLLLGYCFDSLLVIKYTQLSVNRVYTVFPLSNCLKKINLGIRVISSNIITLEL